MTQIIVGYDETTDLRTGQVTRNPRTRLLSALQTEKLLSLAQQIENHIETSVSQTQQRLLTAVYARAIGRGNAQAKRKAKADTLLDWVESVSKHFYTLAAQVQAAQTIEALDAVQFVSGNFPPPALTARDVLLTED